MVAYRQEKNCKRRSYFFYRHKMERVIRLALALQLFCHWFVIFQSELFQGTVMQHCSTQHSLQIVFRITYLVGVPVCYLIQVHESSGHGYLLSWGLSCITPFLFLSTFLYLFLCTISHHFQKQNPATKLLNMV